MAYTCLTCSLEFNVADIGKHISTTRHKSVKFNDLDETVSCEDCGNEVIHQLKILRFGLSDMSLLCVNCESNNEKTSTQYTLDNGAFFSKLPAYYKFRDIECQECHAESNLYVANKGALMFCKKCLPNHEKKAKFVSEHDDTFLTELLGFKESPSVKAGPKRSRKMGRRKKPKKVTAEMEARRAYYMENKEKMNLLKSGSTIKAVGATLPFATKELKGKGKTGKSSKAAPSRLQASKQTSHHTAPKPNGKNSGKTTSKSQNNSRPSSKASLKPTSHESSPFGSKPATPKIPTPDVAKNSINGNKAVTNANGGNNKKDSATTKEKKDSHKKAEPKKGGKETKDEPKKGGKEIKDGPKKGGKDTKGESKKGKKDTKNKNSPKDQPSTQAKSTGRDSPVKNGKGLNGKNDQQLKKGVVNDVQKSGKNTPKAGSKAQTPETEEYTLSSFISEQTKSKPRLTYDSKHEYFREISFNMFVEESLAGDNIKLTHNDALLEWYQDQDKKAGQFKVTLHAKNDIAQLYIPDKLKTAKKKPFSRNQSFFLVLNGTEPWYGYIADIQEQPRKKSVVEMIIVLYDWNDKPLPKSAHASTLTLLPASAPATRVFQAMTTLTNEKFLDMVLGKKPIKQIVFDNRVNFSSQNLNASQKVAVQSVLNNAITVLQGPPGTGKTLTIFEIILQLLNSLNTYPILVVASSNIAVDNIAEKLMKTHAKDLLRITANDKEREYTRSHPLGSICLHHKSYDALGQRFKDVADDLKRGTMKLGPKGYSKYLTERIEITDQLVAQAKVIFTTTVSAGGPQLRNIKNCPVVIMDEATQSSEPTTLIPLAMPGIKKFVFVGDQKQLSCFSLIPKLSLSLFERVLLNGIYRNMHMLDTQYRMHPKISEFPIARFYQGKLANGITAENRKLPGIPDDPVYFWDTKGAAPESTISNRLREDGGRTYVNRKEIERIIQVVRSLIVEKNVPREEIGIITPYSGQRDLISAQLVKDDVINPSKQTLRVEVDKEDLYNESKPVTIHLVSDIMIASIDAFQGREKNFMVMSCVRSNNKNTIGFLRDERRLNVALTRAKYGMILVGDAKFLQKSDKLWGEYLNYLYDKKWVHDDDQFTYDSI